MKILLLNPHIDAEHKIVKAIQEQGHAVLVPGNANEAWQLLQLHGSSVDIAVLHREGEGTGNDEAGLKLASRIKADPVQADLPYIVTSEMWGDTEFARHQQTSIGANAYLAWPFGASELMAVVGAVLGQTSASIVRQEPSATAPPSNTNSTQPPGVQVSPERASNELEIPVLLDAEAALGIKKDEDSTSPGIVLEAPVFEDSLTGSTSLPTAPRNISDQPLTPAQAGPIEIAVPPIEFEKEEKKETTPSAIEEVKFGTQASHSTGIEIQIETPSNQDKGSEDKETQDNEPTIHWGELSGGGDSLPEFQKEEETGGESSYGDEQAAQEMPYLFQKGPGKHAAAAAPSTLSYALSQPLGDAVVPGGAANSPDAETLKKYLLLREQDVAVLSAQVKTLQEQVGALESELKDEKARNAAMTHALTEQKRKIDDFENEKALLADSLQTEANELRFQMKAKVDRARLLEAQVREAAEETERLKERVRADIRKIRVREKELENRLEIMKKDSEALISARENKIIELKRKIDLLEFNMDLLQDQYTREKETSAKLRDRLARAAQVVRVAGGLLEPGMTPESKEEDQSKQEAS